MNKVGNGDNDNRDEDLINDYGEYTVTAQLSQKSKQPD